MSVLTKPCSKCGIGERMNKHSWCAECNRAYQKERRTNPATRAAHLAGDRRRQLKFLYGITVEEYDSMVASQNGLCLICTKEPEVLVVDHCHETGAVRGLLCRSCNAAIGLLGDTSENLIRAASYLMERENNR